MAIGAESDQHRRPSSGCSCRVARRSIAHGVGQLHELDLQAVAAMHSVRTVRYVSSSSEYAVQVHCPAMVEGHCFFVWDPFLKRKCGQARPRLSPATPSSTLYYRESSQPPDRPTPPTRLAPHPTPPPSPAFSTRLPNQNNKRNTFTRKSACRS